MRYGVLFEVEILHDHFLSLGSRVHEALDDEPAAALRRDYSLPGFLDVRPTFETRRRLAGHRLLFKQTGGGFRVGVRLDAEAIDDRPAVPQASDLRLRFALSTTDAAFHNYTALAESAPRFYLFGNGSANEAAGGRFLSLPVAPFDAARRYEAGEVRAEPAGGVIDLFQAVRDTGPAATPVAADWQRIPPDTFDAATTYATGAVVLSANRIFRALVDGPGTDLNDAADWQPLGFLANQYVTRADGRVLRPSLFDLDVGAAGLPQVTVRLTAAGAATPAWERGFTAESGNLQSVQLVLGRLAPGRYRLDVLDAGLAPVAGLGEDIYLDDQALREAWLGVIEIVPGSGGLALLDGTGALRSPRFTLRFPNRPTRWRYIFPDPQTTGSGAEVAVEGSDPRVLVTAAPRPLTRYGSGVRLQDDLLVLLPEPGVERIRRQADQWFSEIHTSNRTI
jgi:hypothetical protein